MFLLGMLLLVSSSIGIAHAQNTYDVNIPTGASDSTAPFFWQSEKGGGTTGVIEILVGDTVVWKNADTAAHTVTSGTPETGPDNMFNSGLFAPGKSYPLQFNEVGTFPYFCSVHPWAVGEVVVTEGLSVLPDVGEKIGDGNASFDLEYKFNRLLDNPQINVDQKSITFELVGKSQSSDHELFLKMPSALLDGPYVIWVDGEKLVDFEHEQENEINTLLIPLAEQSKTLTIVGTYVVPEFGTYVMIVLLIAMTSVMVVSFKFKPNVILRV